MSVTRIKQLKVLLADDHELLRMGLRALIERVPEWRVCGEASTGPEAIAAAGRQRPDIAVVDLAMPGLDGLEVARRIKRKLPSCEVLIFTGCNESDDLIRKVFASGASSYISKADAGKFLIDGLTSLAAHKPYVTRKASAVMFASFTHPQKQLGQGRPAGAERLSPSENLLVRLLAGGHSNAAAARRQRVSVRAVETRRAGIMRKLQLKTFADLVRYAARNDIIKL
jgi:DNA-binding NarL/FixJ family response regulator